MKKRISCLILCFVILACLFGCADRKNNDTPDAEPTAGAVQLDTDSTDESVLVYIGAASRGFEAYPVDCGDEVTPDELIRQISELTGWNLDLTKPAVMDDSPLELPEFGMSWVDGESYKWTNGFCTEQHCSGQTPAA